MINPFGGTRGTWAVLFLAGIALGAWGMRVYFDRTLRAWDPLERLTAQLTDDLKLSVAQKRQVAAILTTQKRRMEDMRDQWRSDVRLLARDGEDQIARSLRDDQMDAFMHLHDRIHGRMDRFLWSSDSTPTAIASAPATP